MQDGGGEGAGVGDAADWLVIGVGRSTSYVVYWASVGRGWLE